MVRSKFLLLVGVFLLLLASCESGPRVRMAPGYDQTPTPRQAEANVLGTPVSTSVPPTPTQPPLILDDTLYTDPSLTLSFYPPQGWDLVAENEGYVKFSRPDGAAWFEGAVESSGYDLSEEAYLNYVDNLLESLYGGTDEYREIEREEQEDRIIVSSSFKKADQQWYAMDFFLQRGRALYALSFQAHEIVWDVYRNSFSRIIDRARTQTGYLGDELVYIFRKPYTAPGGSFTIYIPLGWDVARDQETYPDGVIETISSPDGEANIDVIVLNAVERLADTDIGQVSIAIMKEFIDQDLVIIADDVTIDGRIRVDWRVDDTGESGYTFFWVNGNLLNILTYRNTDEHEGLYRSLLVEIGDSLDFPEAELEETEEETQAS